MDSGSHAMDHVLSAAAIAPLLEDEDLLPEVLLRLPPQPSSLPRASLVCKHWRRILTDPCFLRRFREHHHRKPPLLGFFFRSIDYREGTLYTPVMDSPDRIPADRFFMQIYWDWEFMGCRHGLAVHTSDFHRSVIVSDPLTGKQHDVSFPPGFNFDDDEDNFTVGTAVLRSAGNDRPREHGDRRLSPFKLVLACHDADLAEASVCTYEAESGAWGDIITTATTHVIYVERPAILVGDALCWLLDGGDILEFNLERQTLAVIEKPADAAPVTGSYVEWCFQILRGGDNALGLAVLSITELSIQLWARKSNYDGVISWVLQKTIQLDELFSPPPHEKKQVLIQGYDEDTNVIFLSSDSHNFMLQLDSMQFKCIGTREYMSPRTYYPYKNVYIPVMGDAAGDDGAENVNT